MSCYTIDDILDAVDSSAFRRGKSYAKKGRVRKIEWKNQGDMVIVEGQVAGSTPIPYIQKVQITPPEPGIMRVHGTCSCPIGFNCKHVAALLIRGLMDRPRPQEADGGKTPPVFTSGLSQWLDELSGKLDGAPPKDENLYPKDIRNRLVYVVEPGLADELSLRLFTAYLRANGKYGSKPGTYSIDNFSNSAPPRHLRANDIEILHALWLYVRMNTLFNDWRGTRLQGRAGAEIFTKIIATGRCHWQDAHGPRLSVGAPLTGNLCWRVNPDGTQSATAAFPDHEGLITAPRLDPPCYIDPRTGQTGEIKTGLPPVLSAAFLRAPTVPVDQTAPLIAALTSRFPAAAIPKPAVLRQRTRQDASFAPCVKLYIGKCPESVYYPFGSRRLVDAPMAQLSFDYEGAVAPYGRHNGTLTHLAGDELVTVVRNPAKERKAAQMLCQLGFEPFLDTFPDDPGNADVFVFCPSDDVVLPDEFMAFCLSAPPKMRKIGWRFDMRDLPFNIHDITDIAAEITPDAGEDWFDFGLGVEIDGRRVNLVPALLNVLRGMNMVNPEMVVEWLEKDDIFLAPFGDKDILALPSAKILPFVRFLLDLLKAEDLQGDTIRLPRYRAAELPALEDQNGGMAWTGGEKLRELGRRLNEFRGIATVASPASFTGNLRPYQVEGVSWLQFLREYRLGGILADDMGLGKTVQALAHLCIEKEAGRLNAPCLAVVPTSVAPNWEQEARRFAPGLSLLYLHGNERKSRFEAIEAHDLTLTTYPLLIRDKSVFLERKFHSVILDEAQVIKNPNSQAAQVARQLNAEHRICLTGTPFENHLEELWSLMMFLMPGLLGDLKRFRRAFRVPIEKQGDRARRELLARRIKPFILRRTKAQVAAELPDKQVMVERLPLSPEQRILYETVRLRMDHKVREEIAARGLARSHIVILDALLKLRQVCCDPRLVKIPGAEAAGSGAKLRRLLEMLPEMIEEGRRILLFSQFTSMLALIENELGGLGINYVKLTGSTEDRRTPVEQFQVGAAPLFLISLKAGGTGLNLTAADTVIHYDPWWNPAVEAQATDRAHRIGQEKKVFVYKLVAQATVEEKILLLQEKKKALADGLLDGDPKAISALHEEDLKELFAPLPQ